MTLLRRPLGVWILSAWCAVQAGAAAVFGLDAGRLAFVAAASFCALQAVLLVGLLLPWQHTRTILLGYVGASIVGVSLVLWFFIFVGVAWGTRQHDLAIATPVAVYFAFLAWTWMYLFHPDVADYLKGFIAAEMEPSEPND